MTHYTKANDAQRRDEELKSAIAKELEQHRLDLLEAIEHMREADRILRATSRVDQREDSFNRPSGIYAAKVALFRSIDSIDWYADFLDEVSDTYYGNIAAFMSPEDAALLKEKYRGE